MSTRIRFRRDTAANWTSYNPTLTTGELGYETNTGKFKIGDNSTAWTSLAYSITAELSEGNLNDLKDVTISSAANGDFLRWNGTAWINDAVNLSTDTVGSFVESLVAGTGITLANNSGEGATPTVTVDTTVIQARVTNVTDTEIGYLDGVTSAIQTQINTKAPLASPTFTGTPLSTTASAGTNTTQIATTAFVIDAVTSATAANTVELGVDTTGSYVTSLVAGTGISVSNNSGESATPTIAIGQSVGTAATVTFATVTTTGDVTVGGNITVSGTTTSINTETLTVNDNIIVLNNNATGAPSENAGIEVERGSSTNVAIRWNETTDKWESTMDGSTYVDINDHGSLGGLADDDHTQYMTNARHDVYDHSSVMSTVQLTDINDVNTSATPANNTFLRYNEGAWVDTAITLGTNTTGNYVESLTAGTGVTLTNATASEGGTPTIAIGQDVSSGAAPTFAGLTLNGNIVFEGATADAFETMLTVTDPTADRTVTFPDVSGTIITTGDTGSVTSTMIADGTIVNADISSSADIADSKLATISTAGKVSNSATTASASAGNSTIVARDSSGNFAAGTVTAALSGNATTATTLATTRAIQVSGDVTGTANFDGSAAINIVTTIAANSVALGTDTTGSYVTSLVAGTGVTLANNSGEGATPTVTVDTTVIQARVANVTDTEIGYLDGVTSAIQTQIDTKAPLASPTFTGVPAAPTAAAATNTTQVATTAFVRAEVAALVGTAGATLDTLGELATALGNDAALSTTLTTSIGLKAPLASPTFTGTVTIPSGASISGFAPLASPTLTGTPLSTTAAADTNTTQIATTAYVVGQAYAKLASPTFTGTVTLPTGTVTSTMILDGTIANADISTTAAIDLGKLADISTSTQTASYTLVLADKNKIVEMSVVTANTLTVPPNSSVAYAVGSQINILQTGAGQTTVTAGAGVTINAAPGLKMRTQWSYATLIKRATDTWVLVGDISA